MTISQMERKGTIGSKTACWKTKARVFFTGVCHNSMMKIELHISMSCALLLETCVMVNDAEFSLHP